jgi:pilus assembly protein CpaE
MTDRSLNTLHQPAGLLLFADSPEQAEHYGQHLARLGSSPTQARSGGLTAAIAWCRVNLAPEILLVDLDGDALPLQSLAELSEVCDPNCQIIALGSQQDVDLYRSLLHGGIFDYLLKPVSLDLLASTLNRARHHGHSEPQGMRSGRTIAVSAAAGGCGTSSVVCGLGLLLSQRRHTATAIVDFDRSNGDQSLLLGYDGEAGLAGALASSELDTRLLQRAMGSINQRLQLLAQNPVLSPPAALDPQHLLHLGGNLCQLFNQVIWDLPASLPPGSLEVLAHAQTRILLTELSVQHARNLHRLLREIGDESAGQQLLVVANAVRGDATAVIERHQFEDFIERPIDLLLPHAGNSLASSLLKGPLQLDAAPAFRDTLLELADLATGHSPKPALSASGNLLTRLRKALNRQRSAA